MKWIIREAALVAALGSLLVTLQPSWLPVLPRLWIVLTILVAFALLVSKVVLETPVELPPEAPLKTRQGGELRRMKDVEQANDFLVAVDYQLFPFLRRSVRDIAAHRLLIHHNVLLDREPELARQVLGEAVWKLLHPKVTGQDEDQWGAVTLDQLDATTSDLENV